MGYLDETGLATLVGKIKGQVVQLTAAEYEDLPSTKESDNKIYFVEDSDYTYPVDNEPTANSNNLVKSGGVYTHTSKIGSGTLDTTAQTIIPAINELDAAIDSVNAELSNVAAKIRVQTINIGSVTAPLVITFNDFALLFIGRGSNVKAVLFTMNGAIQIAGSDTAISWVLSNNNKTITLSNSDSVFRQGVFLFN